jgi:hypothetical protein
MLAFQDTWALAWAATRAPASTQAVARPLDVAVSSIRKPSQVRSNVQKNSQERSFTYEYRNDAVDKAEVLIDGSKRMKAFNEPMDLNTFKSRSSLVP